MRRSCPELLPPCASRSLVSIYSLDGYPVSIYLLGLSWPPLLLYEPGHL